MTKYKITKVCFVNAETYITALAKAKQTPGVVTCEEVIEVRKL